MYKILVRIREILIYTSYLALNYTHEVLPKKNYTHEDNVFNEDRHFICMASDSGRVGSGRVWYHLK